MEQYFVHYSSLEQQRWMVADEVRTTAFAKAISEVVKPGDVVIDVGAGTGILSILAAKAGAKRVIGIERSNMADLAKKLIKHNNLEDVVEIYHGNAFNFSCDVKADVIISEWLGHMAYVEDMFNPVIHVRDNFLKPEGIMLPSHVEVMLAPLDDSEAYNEFGPGFWQKGDIHGVNFSCFEEEELKMGHAQIIKVPDRFMLSDGKYINRADCKKALRGDEWSSGSVQFNASRDGELNGFVGWFNCRLSSKVLLDTAPDVPVTHWKQTYFPFHPFKVNKGDSVKVDYNVGEPFEDSRLLEVILKVNGQKINYIVE